MSDNQQLLAAQYLYLQNMHHVIEVTTWSGHDNYGKPTLDPTTTRRYNCYLQTNETTRWNTDSATDAFPYVAYVLSVPIGGSDAVPIRREEQVTVITPSYWESSTPRRLGKIQGYFDQYGNLFVQQFSFE